jgi:hypothetical protein
MIAPATRNLGESAALALLLSLASASAAGPVLTIQPADTVLHLTIPAPKNLDSNQTWQLVDRAQPARPIAVTLAPAVNAQGLPAKSRQLIASIPPGTSPRQFVLQAAPRANPQATGFRFAAVTDKSLGLWESQRPVLVYNHGVLSQEGVPEDRNRSTYVHPIYGLEGEVLTDDFPKDHYHHRGLFWAWPHIFVEGKEYDVWAIKGMHQKFVRWLERSAGPAGAVLGVENGWFIGDEKVLQERVWLRVYPAADGAQAMDVDLTLIAVTKPITLQGAPKKSYGGMSLRFAPRTNEVITTPLGSDNKDLAVTRLPWADYSGQFAGASHPSGAAIFISPDHPDYPPTWLTRHYGVLCVGWPGVETETLAPGKPVHCRYRVWIHRGPADQARVERAYESYTAGQKIRWGNE